MIGTDVLRLQKNKLYQAKRGNKQGVVDSTSDLSQPYQPYLKQNST